jgi:HPt (histidine-containing phosphotransfer) domain-containing protein
MSHVDVSVIKNMIGDNPAMIRKFLVMFVDTVPPLIDDMNKTYAAGNYTHLKAVAHKMKSSAKAVGALHLAELCMQIEVASGDKNSEVLKKLVDELAHEFMLCRQDIESNNYT